MNEQSANLAYAVFRDLRAFSVPTFWCGLTFILHASFGSWSDTWRKAILICGAIQFLGIAAFVLDDGADVLLLSRLHPLWGIELLLGIIASLGLLFLAWQLKSKNDSAALLGLWGIAESNTEKLVRQVNICGLSSVALLLISLFWLWILSRGHDSFV